MLMCTNLKKTVARGGKAKGIRTYLSRVMLADLGKV